MNEHIKIIDAIMESLKFSTVDRKPILPTLKVAKEAMQRRTPMKPGEEFPVSYCPICNRIIYPQMKFCCDCGQALDWEKGGGGNE